jgi:hypothetical protein
MSLTALLARCLLVLALVVNGLPAMAQPVAPAEPDTAAAASCHDDAGHGADAQPAPADPGCCDGGDCTCTCLHHAPATLAVALAPATVHRHETITLGSLHIAPGPALLPSLRPPIA